MPNELCQIGDAAERTGLSLRTVRYYEEVGLVSPSRRSDGGFRLYCEDDVQRLLLVKRMKPLGLALDEMRELLDLLARSARSDELPTEELHETVAALDAYAHRSDAQITTLEQELNDARHLRLRLGERLGRLEAALEQRATAAR
ncbi:MAG TPA: MerR family transcriptional regulator [Gaiellaceae bacterium]|nr:MerR family transcriptional regulator [Gaiellaceae bacterium]